jgi:hypothetical protein
LLLQDRVPITYVSRQLGHKDPSITLRVYSHWLPEQSLEKLVDVLDDAAPRAPQTALAVSAQEAQRAVSGLKSVVSQSFVSWNRIASWLLQIEALRGAA